MKANVKQDGKSYKNNKLATCFFTALMMLMLPSLASGQDVFYYHTESSHGLSFVGGRTARINYMYQMSHSQQFKMSGSWIRDTFENNGNEITSNTYSLDLQLQYNLINIGRFFLNGGFGFGGYFLQAKDVFNNKAEEWRFNFVGGGQAEFYIVRNSIALTLDYDVLITPWSKVYNVIHVPAAGVTFYFF